MPYNFIGDVTHLIEASCSSKKMGRNNTTLHTERFNVRPETLRLHAKADPHFPGRYRVNGLVANMPEFQHLFNCPAISPMVKKDRCRGGSEAFGVCRPSRTRRGLRKQRVIVDRVLASR
jgi:hypothetical protein